MLIVVCYFIKFIIIILFLKISVIIWIIPGAFVFIFPLCTQQLTPQLSSSKENIFILLNQIISLDKFPRGRVVRPDNISIFLDFSLCCNIAFEKKKKRLTAYTRKQQCMDVLIFQRYVHQLKF